LFFFGALLWPEGPKFEAEADSGEGVLEEWDRCPTPLAIWSRERSKLPSEVRSQNILDALRAHKTRLVAGNVV